MKVLMVAGAMHVGGIENQLMHLTRNADKEQFQIDFTSTKPDAFYREEIEELGGNFILLSVESREHPFKYCREMYRIMKNGKYDIVHSHELFHSGITLFLAKLAGIPCRFAHAHNWCEGDETGNNYSFVRRMYQKIMRFLICHCSTVQIACSTWAGKFLYGEKTMKKDSYHLVYNSVDTKNFLDKYEQKETGELCEPEWKNVINVARVSVVKNQIFLVEVAKELKRRNKNIRILCVGSGDDDIVEKVSKAIKDNQVEDHIIMLGVRKDVDVLFRKSHAFILPSKYEGMPLVMIEAQATGLPCISADTYSREVDFGLDMVKWLSLEAGVKEWTDAVEEAVDTERATKEKVEAVVYEKGFDSKVFTQTLCTLYQQDYNLRGNKK